MKRHFWLIVLPALVVGWLWVADSALGQSAAAAVAAQEEAEERYRRLAAQIEEIKASQALFQQQIIAMEKAIRELGDQVVRANNAASSQDGLRRLAEQVQKVDEARVADNKRVFETMEELRRLIKNASASVPPRPAPRAAATTTTANTNPGELSPNDDVYTHEVQKGDTLSGIVQAFRAQNIKVSTAAIKEANPKVDWDRLQIGQKILIPKPKT